MTHVDQSLSVAGHILGKAVQLHETGFHAAAIVTAQSACEVAAEWTVATLLARRGAGYLHPCVDHLVGSYNPTGRVRDLYVTLSGDHIQSQPFWRELTECVRIRNAIVHRGESASAEQAAQYLEVAQQLIRHLEAQCESRSLSATPTQGVDVPAVSSVSSSFPRPEAARPT